MSGRYAHWLTVVGFAMAAGACSGGDAAKGGDAASGLDAATVTEDADADASDALGGDGGFAEAIFPILQAAGCGFDGCHTIFNAVGAGWALSNPADTYAHWVNYPGSNHCGPNGERIASPPSDQVRVIPGDPDSSLIMKKLTAPWEMCGEFYGHMPPSPDERLSANQIDRIRAWILAGAPP